MEQTLAMRAFAKINIGLRILRKRPDGYHDLETVFYEVEPFDEIVFSPSSKLELTTDHPALSVDETNLCLRAARLLQQEMNVTSGVRIHLKKRIPMGAGLGGGSSNAAAVLVGLSTFWNLTLSDEKLHHFAAQLGSDVPFFLRGKCAYATGRGEVLQPVELSIPYWILVVTPPLHVSTAWAYQSLALQTACEPIQLHKRLADVLLNPALLSAEILNDFERPVFAAYPDIEKLKTHLKISGAVFALMSGSGSSVFGFFTSKEIALQAASALPSTYKSFLTPPHYFRGKE